MSISMRSCPLPMRANRSVNADAQGRPPLRGSNSLGAGYVRR
jgi:hypothetical protein